MEDLSPPASEPPAPLSTGALRLDLTCGGGIFPGEVVEICGPPESGKSALCLHLAAEALQADGECAWIDADWSFDPAFARRLGVRFDAYLDAPSFVVARPLDTEAAMDMLCRLAAAGPRLVVIDSWNGLVSRLEIDDPTAGEERPSDKLLSLALRRLAPTLHHSGTSLVIVRQTAETRGAGSGSISAAYHGLGQNLERLSFNLHTTLIVRLDAARPVYVGGKTHGLRMSAHVIRPRAPRLNYNSIKIAPCLQRVDFDIMYKQGFIRTGEVFDLGIETGSILLREGRYFFQDQELGLGRAVAIQELDRRALTQQIVQVIRQQMLRKHAQEQW